MRDADQAAFAERPRGRTFLDTNILLYADDLDASSSKRAQAIALIERHLRSGTGVVSTQVLQEYYVVATGKFRLPPEVAQQKVELFARFDLVQVDLPIILAAIDVQRLQQLSFWDALILQAARAGGCKTLLSEDMQGGATLRGVRIINPFA